MPAIGELGSSCAAGSPDRPQTGHDGAEPDVVDVCTSTQGLSEARIAEARRVWSKAYGRVLDEQEAIEILLNVRRLAEALLRAEEERES